MAIVSSPQPLRTPPPASRQSRGDANGGGQAASDLLIASRIAEAQTALWRAELSRALLIPVMATMVGFVAWAVMDQWIWSPNRVVRSIALISGIGALVAWFVKRVLPLMSRQIQPEYAAYSLEHDLPELRHSLTSYVSLRDDQQREGVRGLVVRSIGVRAAGQLQSHQIEVPSEATGNLAWWLGVAGALALAAGYALFSPKDTLQSTKRLLLPLSSIESPTRVTITDVLPGATEVLAGRPFEVSALINGLSTSESALVEYGDGFSHHHTLAKNAESGRFLASISVDRATQYRVVAGDSIAGPFDVTTRDVPVVSIEQVTITPPAYTKLPLRTSRGGAIVAEENSFAKVDVRCNRPVERARIEFNPRQSGEKVLATGGFLDLKLDADKTTCSASFPLKLPVKSSGAVTLEAYRVRVWDSQGHENPEPIVYPIRIIADLVPEITIVAPTAALTEVPINGAQKVEVHSLDPDYGLKQIEVQIRKGIDVLHTETIWSSVEGDKGSHDLFWFLKPESLGLRVNDTVQVTAIASDNRQDSTGQPAPNVITSDSIEIKVIARDENAKLPKFDKPEEGNEQGDGTESDTAAQQGGNQDNQKKSDQGQGGQGGSGGEEGSETSEGQSGSGSDGKQSSNNEKQAGDEEGQGGSQSGMPSNKEPGESNGSKQTEGQGNGNSEASGEPSENQDQPSGENSGENSNSDGSGKPSGDMPSESNADQGSEGQSGPGQSGAANGKPAGKPQHDGDAFERIRDFIDNKAKGDDSNKADSPEKSADGDSSGSAEDQSGDQSEGAGKPGKEKTESGDSKPRDPKANNAGGDASKGGDGQSKDDEPKQPAGSSGNGSEKQSDSQETSSKPEGSGSTAGSNDQNQSRDPAESMDGSEGSESGDSGSDSKSPKSDKPQTGSGDSADKPPASSEDGASNDSQQGSGEKGKPQKGLPQKGQGGEADADANKDAPGDSESESEDAGKTGQGTKSDQAKGRPAGDDAGKESNGEAASDMKPQSDDKSKNGKESKGTPSGATPNSSGDAGETSKSDTNDGSVPTQGGEQTGEPGGDSPVDNARPPDPIDVDYAKKATDLVLDYLESQKEAPDPDLLESLDWTPEELRAFAERWSRIRDGAAKSATDQKQIEEALRSLGIRAKQDRPLGRSTDTDDALRGLKDAGNRTPPPPIHRDAFDAFRRNANRQ
jgi:hypothetical protein